MLENEEALYAFSMMRTQLRAIGFGTVIGFDFQSYVALVQLGEIASPRDTFHRLVFLTDCMLDIIHEKDKLKDDSGTGSSPPNKR